MSHAKVTSKGQITIPKRVREELGIRVGDVVTFLLRDDHALLRPIHRTSLRELHGALPATRPFPGRDEVRRQVREERAARRTGRRDADPGEGR